MEKIVWAVWRELTSSILRKSPKITLLLAALNDSTDRHLPTTRKKELLLGAGQNVSIPHFAPPPNTYSEIPINMG